MKTGNVRCEMRTSIDDPAVREALWRVYLDAFATAEEVCIQEQLCYSEETFMAAMLDPAYLKFVVYEDDDPVGLLLCTNDLEKARVAYVNPRRLLRDYPDREGRIYYYTAIAVRPGSQGRRCAGALIEAVGKHMDDVDGLSAFDFSNEKNGALPDLILHYVREAQRTAGWRTKNAELDVLGGQTYVVIKLS